MGVRGWIAALDARTGKESWRAYNLGPDADVKIGPRFAPFYAAERGTDLGSAGWPSETWRHGGAATWGWLTYDPELNLVYYTSNPGPWDGELRLGDNKYSSSILARDPDTGELRWALQVTPHNVWDYDAVNESIVADLPINGQCGKCSCTSIATDSRTRSTGRPGRCWWPSRTCRSTGGRVDLATGRPRVNAGKVTHIGKTVANICPSLEGGKNQQPAAFSPATGLFYVPTNNLCMDFTGRTPTYIAGTPYIGADRRRRAARADIVASSWRGTRRPAGRCGNSRTVSRVERRTRYGG